MKKNEPSKKPKKPARTSEQTDQVVRAAAAGLSLRKIAERAGVSHDTVWRWLKEDAIQQRLTEAEAEDRARRMRRIGYTVDVGIRQALKILRRGKLTGWEWQAIMSVLLPLLEVRAKAGDMGGMEALALIFGRVDSHSPSPDPKPPAQA